MKFKTIAEAFNHYRAATLEDIERRAAEIKGTIETDPEADITTLNIELSGLKQAKENLAAKQQPSGGDVTRGAFNPITGKDMNTGLSVEAAAGDVFASPEYRSAFFKSLLGQRLNDSESAAYERAKNITEAERRADAFNTVTSAAAVLPTATLNEVISKARTMGGLLPVCRSFNSPTKLSVPVGTPSNKASWHVEGAKVDSEENTPVSVMFSGYEILKVFSISAAARKMSISAFESYITDELTNCVMECTVPFTSVKVVAALKRGYANGAKWAMNNAALYKRKSGRF